MTTARTASLATLRKAAAEAALQIQQRDSAVCRRMQQHWQQALAEGDFAGALYQQLFSRLPALQGLFAGDMREQEQRLTHTLDEAVRLLDAPDQLLLLLRASGARHLHYRVDGSYFALLGDALQAVLAQRLGTAFDATAQQDWQQFYQQMALIMQAAMAESRAQSA